MGERRLGSGGRVFGPNDLQICRAIDGRMETAQEYVKKVRLYYNIEVLKFLPGIVII